MAALLVPLQSCACGRQVAHLTVTVATLLAVSTSMWQKPLAGRLALAAASLADACLGDGTVGSAMVLRPASSAGTVALYTKSAAFVGNLSLCTAQ